MLLPAAVHPESGYRYYDPSQVAEAEVVVAQFDLVAHDGKCRVRPAMIHRSIVSTMERMVAHLLEVHNGALPVWLAPTQVRIPSRRRRCHRLRPDRSGSSPRRRLASGGR